jgi:hypothetical protein
MGTLFVECSAKTNVGVQDIFQDLVRKVCEWSHESLRMELTSRYWKGPNFGHEALRRTKSSRYKRMRMIKKDGVAARLDILTLYVPRIHY